MKKNIYIYIYIYLYINSITIAAIKKCNKESELNVSLTVIYLSKDEQKKEWKKKNEKEKCLLKKKK